MRIGIAVAIAVITVAVAAQEPSSTTIVNQETAPFVYVELPTTITSRLRRADAIAVLRSGGSKLRVLAPTGVLPLREETGAIVGYYAGGPSAVTYTLVLVPNVTLSNVVRVGRERAISGARRYERINPWELPERNDTVLLDGLAVEWADSDLVTRFPSFFTPLRVERTDTGAVIDVDDARWWGIGGTFVRTVQSRRDVDTLYLYLRTETPVEAGTSYHLTVFASREDPEPLAEYVVRIDAVGGPIVRLRGGHADLGGQFAVGDRAIEIALPREQLETSLPRFFDGQATFDLATARVAEGVAERYTLATLTADSLR